MRFRASALGGLFFVVVVLVASVGPGAALDLVGHPRCNIDGDVADYTWWAGGENVAITEDPFLQWDDMVVDANVVNCAVAMNCMAEWPEMAGRAATIVGTSHGDVLMGTDGPDLIVGGSGDDEVDGLAGRDTICGGPGDDVLVGGRADDRLFGRGGDDELHGGTRFDLLNGGAGNDVLFGDQGDDLMRGRAGRDALYGGAGNDDIRGGWSRDVCFGGTEEDVFTSCAIAAPDVVEYGSGAEHTFRVEVDELLDESLALTTAYVDWILSDARSWVGAGSVKWRRVDPGESADLTIILGAPATVDEICRPLRTGGYFSCRNGDTIGINVNRWNTATDWWPASLRVYRTYVINHEVGHYLGRSHVSCPGEGELARVMQQQTKTLGGCVANGWVYPEEQP